MSLEDIAGTLESVGSAVALGGRTLLGLDTNAVPSEWDHVTKVDPEGEKRLPICFPLYLSHTSAVSVGGSRDVTGTNTEETFEIVNAADVPAFHEPSAATHVTERTRNQADFLAVPEVLNGDSTALVGTLGEGIEYVKQDLGPDLVEKKLGIPMDGTLGDRIAKFAAGYLLHTAVFEAYIIMNPDSAAAREANVSEADLLTPQEARQRALAAEYHLDSDVIYLEYSGTYGGEEAIDLLEAIDDAVSWSRIWYGGGLDNRENAEAVLEAGADTVVVGDIFHEIAAEEADLTDRAREAFDGDSVPDREEIRAWLTETVEVGETSAARYLSTIPDVPDPEDRAERYLAAGIEMALAVGSFVDDVDDQSRAEIRKELETDTLPGEAAFADVIDSDPDTVARDVTLALVADRFDGESDVAFASQHFAPEL